jgi:hypothetical protein
MPEEFVSEQIIPAGEFDPDTAVAGEPVLPHRFTWRTTEYIIDTVLEKWKESGPCSSGGGEVYLRKHWWKIKTADGLVMKLYFERQPRSKRQRTMRWWLYTVETPD